MRSFRWFGRLFVLALLSAFVLPGFAEADRGRGRDRDRDDRGRWSRSRVVVRSDYGRHRRMHYHDRYCSHWDRGRHNGWRNRDRDYYPSRHRHYPQGRRGSVGVVIHIPF